MKTAGFSLGTKVAKYYLAILSHTHWDREWYLSFQSFRLKLVDLVDQLLELLDSNPEYRYFMLDGQTAVLEDYLEMRPESRDRLKEYIKSGRVLVGPWYVLPDEFLVSGEALIRNLLIGHRMAREFGSPMKVGYLPDCFGHIAEIPQILRGFRIDSAVVWRGVADNVETTEFLWRSPDGSKVLTLHLPHGYFNAHRLPEDLTHFLSRIDVIRSQLEPRATTPYLALMNGSDHAFPEASVPGFIVEANEKLPEVELIHTNLSQLLEAIKESALENGASWPLVEGELRDSKRAPLLPGILSTRIWIKQRNFECESLLEKWAEPFSAWSLLAGLQNTGDHANHGFDQSVLPAGHRQTMALRQAWRYLLQNHPHDSICGCSVDQVHEEMKVRFDWSEQIAKSMVEDALQRLVASIDTETAWSVGRQSGNGSREMAGEPGPSADAYAGLKIGGGSGDALFEGTENPREVEAAGSTSPKAIDRTSIVVFNPLGGPRSDLVRAWVPVPPTRGFALVDELGKVQSCQVLARRHAPLISADATRDSLLALFNGTGYPDQEEWSEETLRSLEKTIMSIGGQEASQLLIASMGVRPAIRPGWAVVEIDALDVGERQCCQIRQAMVALAEMVRDREDIALFQLRIKRSDQLELGFVAGEVPGYGYRTYQLAPNDEPIVGVPCADAARIENEYLVIEVDPESGTLTVTDKETGHVLEGLNHFVDGGDCGDEYNHASPIWDTVVDAPSSPPTIEVTEAGPAVSTIKVSLTYDLPTELTPTRRSRLYERVGTSICSHVSLYAGVKRVDVHTAIENHARDHRLRVHFPVEMDAERSWAESHFGIVDRPVVVQPSTPDWAEDAVGTHPQKRFVDINDGVRGLTVANRGLPEYEILRNGRESTIALTLIRAVGWLSRDDLKSRRGHAGPGLETPGAQCLGTHVFEYSIIPHDSTWNLSFEQAHWFSHPMRAVTTDNHNGFMASTGGFLEVEPRELVVSAIKLPEKGDGLVVRFYNITRERVGGSLRLRLPFRRAEMVDLEERSVEVLRVHGDRIDLSLGPAEISTVKFSF